MRHFFTIITLLIISFCKCNAQPTAVKNMAKSVFTLTTYSDDGTQLATSHGVFTGDNGEAISDLKPFIGAAAATVTDVKGKQMNVSHIIGINELYDVVKFKVDGKTTPALMATSASTAGSEVWFVTYAMKSPAIKQVEIKNVEPFMDKYSYYILNMDMQEEDCSCPFVNDEGQVIGLAQRSATSRDIHATDANFTMSLQTSGLSLSDQAMRKIGIPPALPSDKDQALLLLMMSNTDNDSIKHASIVNDFITQYPTLVDGYAARAQMYVNDNDFASADKEMEMALNKAEKKDEAHYSYSQLIYNKEVYKSDVPYQQWSLDKAEEEINAAYSLNPQAAYQTLLARILYVKGEYQQAYDIYMPLTKSTASNSELFYEASQCKQMLGAPNEEIIALLDSAISNTDTLRLRDAAPYFFARAEIYNAADSFRQAVFDYTRYEILVNGNVTSQFYYIREQAEVKAKLYKQALADISHAIYLSPDEPTYYAEKASLEIKVNMMDSALESASKCIEIAPEYATGYLLLGLVQVNNGNKEEGIANFEKAKELGDEQAQALIDKYSN
ncbi:MAG: hypothetical protein LUC88_01850 [Prevotella sp.]|nr:hypothetical protein [Prevotella sp.]